MRPKIDYDKLQDNLEYIKAICEDVDGDCSRCPLGDREGICRLGIRPSEWKPKHPATDAFRVLD